MAKIIINENLILVAVKEVKEGSVITAGGLMLPTTSTIEKGKVGATEVIKTEWGIYLEIVDSGSKVDKTVYKPGLRIKLLRGYIDGVTSFDLENYTNNLQSGTYMFVEPRIIACMFEYESPNEQPEVVWKGDNSHYLANAPKLVTFTKEKLGEEDLDPNG